MRHRRIKRQDRRFISAMRAGSGRECRTSLSIKLGLEPQSAQAVDIRLEFGVHYAKPGGDRR